MRQSLTCIAPDAAPFGPTSGCSSFSPPRLSVLDLPQGLDSPYGLPWGSLIRKVPTLFLLRSCLSAVFLGAPQRLDSRAAPSRLGVVQFLQLFVAASRMTSHTRATVSTSTVWPLGSTITLAAMRSVSGRRRPAFGCKER